MSGYNFNLPSNYKPSQPAVSYHSSWTAPSSNGFTPSVNVVGGGNPGAIGGSASVGGSYTSGSHTFGASVGTAGRNFQGQQSFGASYTKRF